MEGRLSLTDIENILHHLNYRWSLQALAMWKGDDVPFEPYRIYEEYEDFISLQTLTRINELEGKVVRTRLRHALIDHYLQRALLPHETEMRTWMKGASASVNGSKIYFRDVISWCQKSSTHDNRRILEKEIGSLCKFLKPFAFNYWEILLEILRGDLGFGDYLDYCHQKKGIDYCYYYEMLKSSLQEIDKIYFSAMDQWTSRRFNLPLKALNRFDAINLLSLGEFDGLFPAKSMKELTLFFKYWGIDLEHTPGLSLDLGREHKKSAQAMCFILEVPEDVYVLMNPEGGWVDLETLWHELGHGLSAVFTAPELSIVEKDMATSYSLSESFAFLLQNLTLSLPFLEDYLGLDPSDSEKLFYHKILKDLSIFRRYAAKFLTEYDMFLSGDLSNGNRYAEMMARYTGFYYQPESHLFDLVPEFYSLDYLMAWMAEAIMEEYMKEAMGSHWIFYPESGDILKRWWAQGNRYDVFQFMEVNDLGPLGPESLLKRWNKVLG